MINMKFMLKMIKIPTPMNINLLWNLGSLLGMCMMIQLISGIMLSMNYCPNTEFAFYSIINLMKNIWFGWMIRLIHMNGASMFFMFMYIHIARSLFYSSYKFKLTWNIGMMMMLLMMMTSFMGYILPWGQMSFWGATVITNLISTIPFFGKMIVEWVWGGFTINNSTLNRFYSMHFILPFMMIIFIIIHLMFLHKSGSNNPMGTNSNMNKIMFHPYFTFKDLIMMIMMMMMFLLMCLIYPYIMNDPENFIEANSLITPIHIQPEWYFLFAYSILRTIPNKLGGVISMILSIMILLILPMLNMNKINFIMFNPMNKIMFWNLSFTFTMLTWIGSKPIELPYMYMSQIITIMYFMYFIMLKLINKLWFNMMM
uniref:Cytochrome b n=1 Tax=Diapriidae sp. ZJUH_2016010 TaxID=2491155 RepID=A0A3S8V0J2_9HYME|nr:cytochrome b [Diapriidae sp. ZJUH_2016010]